MNKEFFFYRLHWLNLLYALYLNKRGKVYYYKSDLPPRIKKEFDIPYCFSTDDGLLIREQAHQLAQDYFKNDQIHSEAEKHFSLVQFDNYTRFKLTVINEHLNPRFIPSVESVIFDNQKRTLEVYIDLIYWKIVLLTKLFADLFSLVISFLKPIRKITGKEFLFKGFSYIDLWSEPNHRHFNWLVTNKIIESSKILYIVNLTFFRNAQNIPNKDEVLKILDQLKVDWEYEKSLIFYITYCKKTLLLFRFIKNIFILIFLRIDSDLYPFQVRVLNLKWEAILKSLKVKKYITTSSNCFPELIEFYSCNKLNIKTILYFYSNNEVFFSNKINPFWSLRNRFAITSINTFLVWDSHCKEVIESRIFSFSKKPHIQISGPIMHGLLSNLELSSNVARKILGINQEGIYIIVFEESFHKQRTLKEVQLENFITADTMKFTCQLIEKILLKFTDINIIFKPKKYLAIENYHDLGEFQRLFHPESSWAINGRTHLISYNCDPYLANVAAEICLCCPMSSTGIFAIATGRSAIFYDPEKKANYFFKEHLKNYVFQDDQVILNYIEKILLSKNEYESSIVAEEIKSYLKLNLNS